MTSRSTRHTRGSPGKAGWWGRLLVTALFAFYVNYVPIHLATATHLNDLFASVAEIAFHHDGHDESEHHHDTDHVPHPASDHNLKLAAQTQAPNALAFPVVFVVTETLVLIEVPKQMRPIPVLERIKPPGESPPGPLLPRAPPLA